MGAAEPAASLVLATFNHERFVDEALASISAQTSRDFEVVIVDDASTDGTVERIRRWLPHAPIEARLIVNERNLGACATRNLAVAQSRGAFVCGVAGDDACEPRRVEASLARFRSVGSDVAVVYADAWLMDVDGTRVGRWFERTPRPAGTPPFDALLERCFVCSPAMMMRRAAFDAVGGYDERHFIDDHSLLLRLAEKYSFAYLDLPVTNYRLNPAGMTRSDAHRARREESHARVLLAWHGRDARHDAVIEPAAWRSARRAFAADPAIGGPLMRDVCRAAPTPSRRLQVAGTAVPGAARALAGLFRLHDARRARAEDGAPAGG